MRLTDPDGWAKTVEANPIPAGFSPEPEDWPADMSDDELGDCYGACIIIAAQRWAELMEGHIDVGAIVTGCAEDTFTIVNHQFGHWGLTWFQYGAVVSILAQVWEHGDELRRWHNLKTQFGDEGERANESGGTLNPALLNIGREDGD
jgi:hypothetical protein